MDSATPTWRLDGFLERLDTWADIETPPDGLRLLAWWVPPVEARLRTSGSLMFGFFVCVLALDTRPVLTEPEEVLIPLLLVALPVLDTVLVTSARLRGSRLEPNELGFVGRLHGEG